ncbi:DUF4097 family beta strand repeat protein [Sedimentibacter sp. zth1]|uniref:DUF4097 family beta strand repeat-containing protein n=1 Tax=Sedimentibacter sp. zth1 TaxID=2816908 RepID=UPI001A92C7F7|nr:DUF4097 family beta strand repeat-containing protein [Sedimentibacter sp. zth1]QSX06588.1 DUF4097 family beta strand repeat protein [Sedimentibacter sp. zth1]
MNKKEFLKLLAARLTSISSIELEKTILYFSEIIDDHIDEGLTEEQAVTALGDIDDIVDSIVNSTETGKKENINDNMNNDKKNESFESGININIDNILEQTNKAVKKSVSVMGNIFNEISSKSTNENTQMVKKQYNSVNEIKIINVKDSNNSIEIFKSVDEKIHIEYYENKNNFYTIEENDGILYVMKHTNKLFKFFSGISELLNKNKMKIFIPNNYMGLSDIKTSNASIVINNLKLNNLKLKSSNGRITATNIEVQNDLILHTSNASINVNDVVCNSDLICTTSNGKIILEDTSCKSTNCHTSNSSINVENVKANQDISLITSNGRIEFDKIKIANALICKTCNSSIKGFIDGKLTDFSIQSSTSNGKNNLPTSLELGDKQISCNTSNGSINVEFTLSSK